MLNYSDDALWVRRLFFAPYNDVSVVVEDRGKENFYVHLLQRLLPNSIKINQVTGVGGKTKVIEQFYSRNKNSQQPEFFLVDGDFDEILGITCPTDPNFFRLARYDIENYLVEENALSLILQEEMPNITAEDHRKSLDIDAWVIDAITKSVRLAAAAALWRQLGIEYPRFPQSIEQHAQGTLPATDSIEDQITQSKSTQHAVREQRFDELLSGMIGRMGSSPLDQRKWISGKHILIPLAMRLIRTQTRRQLEKESLCFRLVGKCEFPELDDLRNRILAIC